MEYTILILGFIASTVGIFGETWNKPKRRPTFLGLVALLAFTGSFIFTFYQTSSKNKELEERNMVLKQTIENRINNATIHLTKHLLASDLNDSNLIKLTDTSHLINTIGKLLLVDYSFVDLEDYNYVDGSFQYPYQEITSNIKEGKKQLQDVLYSYSSVLDLNTYNDIERVLKDEFLNENFSLLGMHQSLIKGSIKIISENPEKYVSASSLPPWSYLGTHYFGINPYNQGDGKKRLDNLEKFRSLINKIRVLRNSVNGNKNLRSKSQKKSRV